MKHLKKFNESLAEKYLQMDKILKDIFAELIDDTSIQVEFGYDSNDIEYNVTIKPWSKNQTMGSYMTPEQMIERYEKYIDLIKDVSVCYKRACDELGDEGKLLVNVDNRIFMSFKVPGAKKEEYPF